MSTPDPRVAELDRTRAELEQQRDKNATAWRRINELEAMLSVRAADRKSLAARDERILELEQQRAAVQAELAALHPSHLVPHGAFGRIAVIVGFAPAPDALAAGTRDEAPCLRCRVCRVAIPTRCSHCELLDLQEGERHGG